MKGKTIQNSGSKSQEKAKMSSSKLPIHWCQRESQLKMSNATRLKIVEREESRAARESGFCERVCKECHHCNKSDTKINLPTSFSFLVSVLG
jgi:hypothetical protein